MIAFLGFAFIFIHDGDTGRFFIPRLCFRQKSIFAGLLGHAAENKVWG